MSRKVGWGLRVWGFRVSCRKKVRQDVERAQKEKKDEETKHLTSAGEIAMKTPRPSAAFNLSTH